MLKRCLSCCREGFQVWTIKDNKSLQSGADIQLEALDRIPTTDINAF
uniref:Uncharacterized protein n=1 Tax=Rhizophora mucronata TaxID=61149 RepID=A0A2P2R3J1_RHIMU